MIYFFGGNPKKKGKHMIFFKIFRERTILLILELFWQLGFCSLCIDDGFLCVVVYSFFPDLPVSDHFVVEVVK